MTRAIPLFLFISLSFSFGAPRFSPHAGDPGIDGKDYLLAESDFRALLITARAHLARFRPQPSIYRVTVISATEVDAWFGDQSAVDSECLILKCGKKGWQVTGEGGIKRS